MGVTGEEEKRHCRVALRDGHSSNDLIYSAFPMDFFFVPSPSAWYQLYFFFFFFPQRASQLYRIVHCRWWFFLVNRWVRNRTVIIIHSKIVMPVAINFRVEKWSSLQEERFMAPAWVSVFFVNTIHVFVNSRQTTARSTLLWLRNAPHFQTRNLIPAFQKLRYRLFKATAAPATRPGGERGAI